MKKDGKKEMRRLRKSHIWPSILSLLLSVLLVGAAAIASMSLIVTYFAEERVHTICNDLQETCALLSETKADDGEGAFALLTDRLKKAGIYEAAYVLDFQGERLCGYGSPSYMLENSISMEDIPENTLLFLDSKDEYRIIETDGGINVQSIVLQQAKALRKLHFQSLHQKEILYQIPFWVLNDLSGGYALMVKARLILYMGDFMLAVVVGMVAVAAMLLPVFFLFLNAIFNLLNHRRTAKLLYTDPKTAGKSRIYFEHRAGKALRKCLKREKCYAVVDISVENYRRYCICHGARAGEELLARIDDQLLRFIRHSECSAHYGTANFAMLLCCAGQEDCAKRLRELLNQLENAADCSNVLYHIGVCMVNCDSNAERRRTDDCVGEYYNRASAARATISENSGSEIAFFDQKMLDAHRWEHRVIDKMQQAIRREEFQVYLQPKYNPANDELMGAEALVRWIDAEEGFISPGRFIPILENNGLITLLDDYMISHVAKLQSAWIEQGKKPVPVSVNVSRAHFANPDLANHICALVDAYRLPHRLLEIELTESAFFDDKAALLRTVRALQERGFEVSMDDFGSGYSSLNALKDLPLDALKLDAGFFRGEDSDGRGEIVVSQAICLAKQLNMKIVAEGIEKKDQVDFLAKHGCDMIQGYFYAKPMPAKEYAGCLDEQKLR